MDLWADVRCEMGLDQPPLTLPISTMRENDPYRVASDHKKVHCKIQKVGKDVFESWETDYISPDPLLRLPLTDPILQAGIILENYNAKVSVLMETGCRIAL